MGNEKHTQGPWKFREPTEGNFYVDTEGGNMVCRLAVASGRTSRDVREANARLIAAAPELLEALKQILSVAPPTSLLGNVLGVSGKILDKARAAIAKAEGKAVRS